MILAQFEHGMDKLFLPLGLLYVADALLKEGDIDEVEIFHKHGTKRNIDKLTHKVKRGQPEWVGFSVMTSPQLIPTIKSSKRLIDLVWIVWGGMHPTIIPNVGYETYVDEIVKGEGESWVIGCPNKNMDDFQPRWSLIDTKKYGGTLHLITSRGCPHQCGFCYSPLVWKRKWKAHSIEKVVEIVESYPIKPRRLEFRDDYFFADKDRAVEIVNRLGIEWGSTIRATDVTDELFSKFKVKPYSLYIGVETGSERLLELMKKGITLSDSEKAVKAGIKHNVPLYCTFIIGLPTETPKERRQTITFSKKLKKMGATVRVKPYRPYPNTPLYELAIKEGFEPPTNSVGWAEYVTSEKRLYRKRYY